MQFQYTATNTEGKELTGVINSDSEENARKQLNDLGFSILEISETQTALPEKGNLEKYEFEAIDKTGKQIKGTIPAKTPLLAYKRLANEYHFTIDYLAPLNATPEEKINLRQTGTQELKNQYELDQNQKQSPIDNALTEDPQFLMEKEMLIQEVNNVLQKVKFLLAQYETKISPTKRAEIEGTIDKLLRIKSSNNLDYIRHTSTELLKKIQEDEIFLTASDHESERQQVMRESQKMMLELSKKSSAQVDISMQIKNSIEKLEEKFKGSPMAFLLHPLSAIKKGLTNTPEIQQLKTQLNVLRTQRWAAIKIALKTSKESKNAAWQNVKEIRTEEKEIQKKLYQEKHQRDNSNLIIKREKHVYFLEELNTFTGWLLFFYLMYYFVGHYVTTQGLALKPILGIPFNMEHSALFKYLLAIVFILHTNLSLKLNFFSRSKTASIVLVPLTLLLSLLTLFNL